MLKIGLTGGIASGKTTVAQRFASLGVPVVDADQVAHELVEPGQSALAHIVAEFGEGLLQEDGHLDRARLRQWVFTDPESRQRLEAILHPRVYQRMSEQIRMLHAPYCILAIPLLLETQRQDFVDRILVVDCAVETQIARASRRDRLDEDFIRRIIRCQVDRAHRLCAADDVIHNDGDLTNLERQVDALHARYLCLASASASIYS